MKSLISFAAALRLAALAVVVPVAAAFAAQPTDAKSFSKVLDEVRLHAAEANDDAEVLSSFVRSNLSLQLHARRLGEIRHHLNDLWEDYSRLQTMRANASVEQRDAIDRLRPLLLEIRASLNNTIQHLAENQKQVNLPSFHAQIQADYQKIDTIYDLLCECTNKSHS